MRIQYHHVITISLFFLIISSLPQKGLVAEGRKTLNQNDVQQTLGDNKVMVRKQIGSRPPRCETRCRFCGH
ncbi:EPIDERMAL PATTERNING FACTOR protein [Trifolium repens]|nr:EPIDERMAL PATTERNING FACTOR protein [Trifolium repens]